MFINLYWITCRVSDLLKENWGLSAISMTNGTIFPKEIYMVHWECCQVQNYPNRNYAKLDSISPPQFGRSSAANTALSKNLSKHIHTMFQTAFHLQQLLLDQIKLQCRQEYKFYPLTTCSKSKILFDFGKELRKGSEEG